MHILIVPPPQPAGRVRPGAGRPEAPAGRQADAAGEAAAAAGRAARRTAGQRQGAGGAAGAGELSRRPAPRSPDRRRHVELTGPLVGSRVTC